jgi:hypothetical protein
MRVVRTLAAATCALVAACASGSDNGGGEVDARATDAPPLETDAASSDTPDVDATSVDAASIDATAIDAASIDAASIDATSIDAANTDAGCTTMVLQRLANPAFDATPLGTGWIQTPHDAAFPIITDADGNTGMVEHTAPNKAWLGGWDETAIDVLYQDVAIPAGTTQLTLRGQYWTATDETGTSVYDTCTVQLQNTSGGVLQNVMTLSNRTPVSVWTAFNFTFTSPQAGQTVRLNVRASSDISNATAFWFDSLALEATVCQ